MSLECSPVLFLLKKFLSLCLSFLEDDCFVDWLVKERLVANKLKEKRRKEKKKKKKKNFVSKGNGLLERKGYPVRYGIFRAIIH